MQKRARGMIARKEVANKRRRHKRMKPKAKSEGRSLNAVGTVSFVMNDNPPLMCHSKIESKANFKGRSCDARNTENVFLHHRTFDSKRCCR